MESGIENFEILESIGILENIWDFSTESRVPKMFGIPEEVERVEIPKKFIIYF